MSMEKMVGMLVFKSIEKSRMWLFCEREALIVTFVKDI